MARRQQPEAAHAMRTSRTTFHRALPIALILGVCARSESAAAADFEYQASMAMGHSGNIRRSETDQQSDTIAAAGVQFSLDKSNSRLNADVYGDVAYNDYLNNTYQSEVIGNVVADARYALIPERLNWVVADNFGQVLGDPFLPATPDNRENLNYLVTGPDLTFALGSQMRMRLGGRYALTTYEKSPFDSSSVLGELGLVRLLSSFSSASLNARVQQVSYDETSLNADYKQSEGFVRYEVQGARTQLSVDGGYTQIDRDASADKQNGVLLRMEVIRRVSASSSATIAGGREFSGAGDAFAVSQGLNGVSLGTAPGRQTTEPFRNDFAHLAWDFAHHRTSVTASAAWADRSYQEAPILDQTITDLSVRARRELSSVTSLILEAATERAHYAQPGHNYDDRLASLSWERRMSRVFAIAATYTYASRSSEFPGGDYTENRIWLSLTYGEGTPRTTRAPPHFGIDSVTP
jgi:Putative beta-barrel porin 2